MFGVACLLGPHGPRGLDTVCWAAATPAGYNRGSLEGAEGAEGTTGQLEVCVPLFQTNESLLRGFFFFRDHAETQEWISQNIMQRLSSN